MTSEQFAILTSVILGFSALFLIVYKNWQRSKFNFKFDLKHNVLMTKHPLLFITGKRSLFYFLKYWNQLPEYLISHGYEVYVLPLPWRKEHLRRKALRRFLSEKSEQNQKFHLFFDSSSYQDLAALFKDHNFTSVASTSLVSDSTGIAKPLKAHSLRPDTSHLRGLKQAIEEFQVHSSATNPSSLRALKKWPLTWTLHQNLTFSSTSPELLGWNAELSTYESYLDRAHFLAERDFSG